MTQTKKELFISELKDELAKLSNIGHDELKKAKKRAKVNFAQDAETVSDIADSIGYYMTVCEDLKPAESYLSTLDEIDEDYLSKFAQKYLNPDVCSISVLLPEGEN